MQEDLEDLKNLEDLKDVGEDLTEENNILKSGHIHIYPYHIRP